MKFITKGTAAKSGSDSLQSSCSPVLLRLHYSLAPERVLGYRGDMSGHSEGPVVPRANYEDSDAQSAGADVQP
jgi:hypothetical protein